MESMRVRFDGDPLASEEYLNNFKRRCFLEPEKELMLAILSDAIECFWKHAGTGTKLFEEAKQWIFDANAEDTFSFINVCEALDLDPDYIRRGIMDWNQRQLCHGGNNKAGEISFVKRMRRNPRGGGKCQMRPRREGRAR